MTISEFAPDTNCRRNGSGIISDFDSTAPPGIGSRDHSRRLDSSPVEQAKKWLIPIHRRANLTGTTSGVQSLGACRHECLRHVPSTSDPKVSGECLRHENWLAALDGGAACNPVGESR